METPSQTLASKIVRRLSDEKLLLPDDAQRLSAKLASGKMAAEDWRFAVEQTMTARGASKTENQA